MDLDLSGNQDLLVKTSTRFIEASHPLTAVRAAYESGLDPEPDFRRRVAELGWFAMLAPEDAGGGSVSENPLWDCALLAQARGEALQPLAFVPINVLVHALTQDGSPQQRESLLPQLVMGAQSATWAMTPPSGAGTPPIDVTATPAESTEGYVLSGAVSMVQDAHVSDVLLVCAKAPEGPTQFVVDVRTPGVTCTPLDGLDVTRRFCAVTFDNVRVPSSALLGQAGRATASITRQLDIACVLTVAETVGAMHHDFEVVLQYAKDRIAFGRPIGSFQAIKHLLADTSLLLEMSKAMVADAVDAVGEAVRGTSPTAGSAASVAASMAKAFVGDCGIELAQNCFQVFGGIGYAWEHDQHLYLRRITTDTALFGDPIFHRERICRLVNL